MVFAQSTSNPIANFCDATIIARQEMQDEDLLPLLYPESLPSFSAHGASGCKYTGDKQAVGKLACPGVKGIICQQDAGFGKLRDCPTGGWYIKTVTCEWVGNKVDECPDGDC